MEEQDDPLHVWYASTMFLTAMDMGFPAFSVSRTRAGIRVHVPGRGSGGLGEFVQCSTFRDCSGNGTKPVPVARVWSRLLEMADMADAGANAGTIRIKQRGRYPYTEWTIAVTRKAPHRLDFRLTLDRVDTSISKPAGGERLWRAIASRRALRTSR
ncbi:MAG: hypothetical protein A3K19_27320 [Lentisphaerae bacterium RIFOXYB12_FULL_65_16]|nr:MAG: hypothetical protein A3K18_15955 [Lentisphaerae bacterium RIFOXYA12_64_32]OGV86401.1 MAG: hypothetical protein A3K19_27320 [Lentisphaerae bacterium RIFOXYB12_FULL_65_16]